MKYLMTAILLVTTLGIGCGDNALNDDHFTLEKHSISNSDFNVIVLTDKENGCQYIWYRGGGLTAMPHTCKADKLSGRTTFDPSTLDVTK